MAHARFTRITTEVQLPDGSTEVEITPDGERLACVVESDDMLAVRELQGVPGLMVTSTADPRVHESYLPVRDRVAAMELVGGALSRIGTVVAWQWCYDVTDGRREELPISVIDTTHLVIDWFHEDETELAERFIEALRAVPGLCTPDGVGWDNTESTLVAIELNQTDDPEAAIDKVAATLASLM